MDKHNDNCMNFLNHKMAELEVEKEQCVRTLSEAYQREIEATKDATNAQNELNALKIEIANRRKLEVYESFTL